MRPLALRIHLAGATEASRVRARLLDLGRCARLHDHASDQHQQHQRRAQGAFGSEATASRDGAEWSQREVARAVQIDIDPLRIGLRYQVEVGLVGDSQRTLPVLLPIVR